MALRAFCEFNRELLADLIKHIMLPDGATPRLLGGKKSRGEPRILGDGDTFGRTNGGPNPLPRATSAPKARKLKPLKL